MAFMRAFVSTNTQRFLLADNLDEPVMCGPNHIYLEPGLYDEDDTMPVARAHTVLSLLDEYKVSRFEIVEKYWGRMEAPGYLDASDFVIGDTRAEVAQQLIDMYFDGGYEGLDEEGIVDSAFLECLVQGKIK